MEPESKKRRSANFTLAEKEALVNIVSRYRHVIENKKTDSVSIKEKKAAWEAVSRNFNAASPGLVERDMETLKKYYKNQKEELRKRLAVHKSKIYLTGGGPPPPAPEWDNVDKILISIGSPKALEGVDGAVAPFDDDYDPLNNTAKVVPDKIGQRDNILNRSIPQLLKTKPSEKLQHFKNIVQCDNRRCIEIFNADENVNPMNTNADNLVQEKEQVLENVDTTLDENLSSVRSSSHQRTPQSNMTRRRPTLVRTLASSTLQEKYEKLINKKLELLNGLEKEHLVRLEILKLEKEIKQHKLKQVKSGQINKFSETVNDINNIDNLVGESEMYCL